MEPSLVLMEMRRLRKGLMPNEIKGLVPSGEDPSQIILWLVKRTRLRNYLSLKSINKAKLMPM